MDDLSTLRTLIDNDEELDEQVYKKCVRRLFEIMEEIRAGNFEESIEMCVDAIENFKLPSTYQCLIRSNRSHCNLLMARCKLVEQEKSGKIDEAVLEKYCKLAMTDAKFIIRVFPEWHKGYYNVGRVYQFQKNFRKAKEYLIKALNYLNHEPETLAALAEVQFDERRADVSKYFDPQNMETASIIHDFQNIKMTDVIIDKLTSTVKTMNAATLEGFVNMAHRYAHGVGVKLNLEMAVELYAIASDAGNMEGTFSLALCYFNGRGTEQDMEEAINLFTKAAEKPIWTVYDGFRITGIAEAQYFLGKIYQIEIAGKLDYDKAIKWFSRAVENGYGMASNELGLMYKSGIGVKKDQHKAKKHFETGAQQGYAVAMENLAWILLEQRETEQSLTWYGRAITGGSMSALKNKQKFDRTYERLLSYQRRVRSTIRSDPQLSRSREDNLNEDESKSSRKEPDVHETILTKCKKMQVELQRLTHEDGESYAATLLRSLNCFERALEALKNFKTENDKLVNRTGKLRNVFTGKAYIVGQIAIHELAQSLRATDFVAIFEPEWLQVLKRLVHLTKEGNETCKEDCDARISSACLEMESLEKCIMFNEDSIKKYPHERFFRRGYCNLLTYAQKFEAGLQATEEALELFPNDTELLFTRASILKLLWNGNPKEIDQCDKVAKAYLKYLVCAPKDHKFVAEAYFSVVMTILIPETVSENQMSAQMTAKALDYFELGITAQVQILACFQPFQSKTKDYVKQLMNHLQICFDEESLVKKRERQQNEAKQVIGDTTVQMHQNGMAATVNASLGHDNRTESSFSCEAKDESSVILTIEPDIDCFDDSQVVNKNRIYICLEHREAISVCMANARRAPRASKHPCANTKKSKNVKQVIAEDSAQCVQIVLSQLENHKDVPQKGRCINLFLVEDPISKHFKAPEAIHTVVRDRIGRACRCLLFNVKSKFELGKLLRFGDTIIVRDPLLSSNVDGCGNTGLIVNSETQLYVSTSQTPLPCCRFCWKENAALKCGKCRRATYCSKDCQVQDWKLLRHKLICQPQLEYHI